MRPDRISPAAHWIWVMRVSISKQLLRGQIWVGYFDEGVDGGGIGTEGLVCFDSNGTSNLQVRGVRKTT